MSSYALTGEQSEITPCTYGRLKRMGNYKTVDSKTLSQLLKRGGRLQQVLNTGLRVVLVLTRMFDFLFFSLSVYDISQITVDVETSFSDCYYIFGASNCPFLSTISITY